MFSDLAELYRLMEVVLLKGGWVGFAIGLVYMFYKLYIDYIQLRWYNKQKWVFLRITAPKENEKSPLAFEQIFNQLHAIHATFTFAEKYIEGQMQIWFVWEVISIGGSISTYVRILEKHRDTLEAAVYSQFPDAEITEAEDYFNQLPKYHADHSEFEIFAFSFIMKNKYFYPIRTFHDFEHSTTDTFVDPVDGMWEELGKLSPYEMFLVQYVFRPVDDDWKEDGYKLVKKLKGVPGAGEKESKIAEWIGHITGPFLDIIIRPTPALHPVRQQDEPPSLMLHLTEGEKNIISGIEEKLSKLSYMTKIRCLYLAPREKYNPGPVYTAVIGAIKSVKATQLNSLKPDTDHWTKVRYWVNRGWERPILELRDKYRKRRFWSMIRRRWFFHGPGAYALNSEEIATILHFPLTTVAVPPIEKVTVKKVQPPPELPIAQ